MLRIFKCNIQKVTTKYLDIKVSHLQTADFWNITPGIFKLLKYHTYKQRTFGISHLLYLNFQNTTPYIFKTFIVSHQLIDDCQNITHDAK